MESRDVVGVTRVGGEASKGGFPNRRDLIRLGVFALVGLGGACLLYWAEYAGGCANNPAGGFAGCLLFFPVLGFAALVFLVHGLFRLFNRPCNPKHLALRLLFVALPVSIPIIAFCTCTPSSPVFLRGFRAWTLRHVDIQAVQQWLATEGPAFAERQAGQSYRYDFPADYPKCLVDFKPKFIWFNRTPEGELTVEFGWGGGLSAWGLIVGPPTMKTPEAGMVRPKDSSEVEFRRPVRPGAYVVDRG